MPASDYFTATSYSDYNETPNYISFRLLGTAGSSITFKDNYNTYFTVIGGGGGGGGGGHNTGETPFTSAYPSGGGGGAGAFGQISYHVSPDISYSYEIGDGGLGAAGNNKGALGGDSSVTFSAGEYIDASGGSGGAGYYNSNVGGAAGNLTVSGVTPIISSSGGAGGYGVVESNIGTDPSGNGLAGFDSVPSSIENYPNNFIFVGGGGGGADARDTFPPPPNPYKGGGGGNGVGGVLGAGIDSSGNGIDGIAYGGGGGGGGQPGAGSYIEPAFPLYPVTFGGNGKEGAIFVYIEIINNGCEWNPTLAVETVEWTRAHTDCVDLTGTTMTRDDLSEKRKATIFQYKNNSAGFSKKQNYSRLARGIGRQRGQSFATQSDTYTNSNTKTLPLNNTVLECTGSSINWALTNQNDTPGPVRRITNNPSVPLTNYIVRRTYLAGNNKWPQFGWRPGMNGFPVGKMGKK